ncbi:polysaccharide deacetylase family protein [Streptomyces sp. NPDC050161]|uniref:polysaccharide deacetylase family protein n=1 Tax=Streptomyces sp. NPDC050161 TaxID=3365604 RepID=UPI0037A69264
MNRCILRCLVAVALTVAGTAAVPAGGPARTAPSAAVTDSPAAARPAALPPTHGAPGPVEELFGSEIRRMPTTRRVVALTFNAAWDETGVAAALAVLRERGEPATFFLTGRFAAHHPAAARAMAAEHGVANHSYGHPRFGALTTREVSEEVLRADRAIRRASGATPLPFFRFPYSATTPRGIADVNALGFADIEFTADTNGYLGTARGMTVRKAVDRAMDGLTPGEIIQMHVGTPDGHGPALDVLALPRLIDAVHARGYRIADLRSMVGKGLSTDVS